MLLVASGLLAYFLLPDWTARASFGDMFGAVNALFSGLALAGVVFAILLQHQDLSLQRVVVAQTCSDIEQSRHRSDLRFAMDLAPRFNQLRADYHDTWRMLRSIPDSVTSQPDPHRERIAAALATHYRSAQFVYQLAVLVEAGVIDLTKLDLLYYEYLTEHPDARLSELAKWCGTGKEVAANYNLDDVLRLARGTEKLLTRLEEVHCGNSGNEYQSKGIRDLIKDLVARGEHW